MESSSRRSSAGTRHQRRFSASAGRGVSSHARHTPALFAARGMILLFNTIILQVGNNNGVIRRNRVMGSSERALYCMHGREFTVRRQFTKYKKSDRRNFGRIVDDRIINSPRHYRNHLIYERRIRHLILSYSRLSRYSSQSRSEKRS